MSFKNLTKKTLAFLIMNMLCLVAFAQERQITGTVVDGYDVPIIGANIVEVGTTNGVITDLEGRFSLTVQSDSKIQVSFIGYVTQTITVNSQDDIKVILNEDSQSLDEVVVVGYGVQKKSDLTGSIGSVDNKALAGKGASTVMESLQGQVAGVDISQSSSRVGESFNIAIRGKSTLGSSTSPLFVVDGVICDDINFLNPSDIEKIDILKDASSTAIYGSRATNGVVIVTTKQAKVGDDMRTTVTYDGYAGYKTVARMPDFMDGTEWAAYRYMKYATPVKTDGSISIIDGRLPLEITPGNMLSIWNDKGDAISVKRREQFLTEDYTDWSDLMLQDGTQQNHFIQVSGGGKKVSYRAGLGYQQEDGVMGDEMQRYNLKLAVDGKINSKVSIGMTTNIAIHIGFLITLQQAN